MDHKCGSSILFADVTKERYGGYRILRSICRIMLFLAAAGAVLASSAGRASASSGGLAQIFGEVSDLLEKTGSTEVSDEEPYHVLLVGSDRREGDWNGNSDTMIMVSIDKSAGTISMVSFMRDLGVEIDGYGTDKLNSAYAGGGIGLLEDTLLRNFGVETDSYVAVDFYEMIDIVDTLGGVDMEVRSDEVEWVNMYIESMCPYMGLDPWDYMLSSEGYLHLNGLQAVAFCRVRFTGDNDYERTERQRRVLTALLRSFDPSDISQVTGLMQELLAETESDITLADILRLAPVVLHFSDYTLTTDRVPFDGLFESSGEMLIPVQPDTNQRIREILH